MTALLRGEGRPRDLTTASRNARLANCLVVAAYGPEVAEPAGWEGQEEALAFL